MQNQSVLKKWQRVLIKTTAILLSIVLILTLCFFGEEWLVRAKFGENAKAKYVVLITMDGVNERDFDFLSTLPNLSKIMSDGVYSKSVESVYPTHTYTIHTSIITGNYPDKTGIFQNHQLQINTPNNEQKWFWYRNEVKGDTIYDFAERKGMRTAGLLYPVTGMSSIDYNFPELESLPGENHILKILAAGSTFWLAGRYLKFSSLLTDFSRLTLDKFITTLAVDLFKTKKPNLTAMHLCEVDDMKHAYGTTSEQAKEAMRNNDRLLGEIIQGAKDAGTYDQTMFIIASDHGLVDVDKKVYINNVFAENGLLDIDGSGKIISYKAYAQTTGQGALIHFSNDATQADVDKAYNLLENFRIKYPNLVSKVFTEQQVINDLHAGGVFKLAVEGVEGVHFNEEVKLGIVSEPYGRVYATHGFSPYENGQNVVFFAFGAGVTQRGDIGKMRLIDIAPTIAKAFGYEYDCDGSALKFIV